MASSRQSVNTNDSLSIAEAGLDRSSQIMFLDGGKNERIGGGHLDIQKASSDDLCVFGVNINETEQQDLKEEFPRRFSFGEKQSNAGGSEANSKVSKKSGALKNGFMLDEDEKEPEDLPDISKYNKRENSFEGI